MCWGAFSGAKVHDVSAPLYQVQDTRKIQPFWKAVKHLQTNFVFCGCDKSPQPVACVCKKYYKQEQRKKFESQAYAPASEDDVLKAAAAMKSEETDLEKLNVPVTEETVTVEVASTGDDSQDEYTSDCVEQALQMTSPSSRWWDATARVTMFVPYFGTVERVGNLSLAHCVAAVGSVELLHKCKDPHELLEMTRDTTTLHLAACIDHSFHVTAFAGMSITPFELRVALSRSDKKKRSIMHYACGNGNTTFLHVVLEHLPYKNMVIPLLQMSDANGCTPTACAVVSNRTCCACWTVGTCSKSSQCISSFITTTKYSTWKRLLPT